MAALAANNTRFNINTSLWYSDCNNSLATLVWTKCTTPTGVACAVPGHLSPQRVKMKDVSTSKEITCATFCLQMTNIRPGQYRTVNFGMGAIPSLLHAAQLRMANIMK